MFNDYSHVCTENRKFNEKKLRRENFVKILPLLSSHFDRTKNTAEDGDE